MSDGGTVVVGVDTGGTFTDFVCLEGDRLRVHKVASTPDNPARALLDGLHHLLGDRAQEADVVHGSTVATNALLERKGARTALITTAGFEDILEIGRQTRRRIYDLSVDKGEPLVPASRRFGVTERIGPQGEVLEDLSPEDLQRLPDRIRGANVESVAVCFLHSYANPEHERRVLAALDGLDVFVTASHVVLPEFREYERCTTTVVNAYVGPVMRRYLARIAEVLDAGRVRIMQSNGGIISLPAAQRHAVQTILSGPAGGAVGGFEIGRNAGFDHLITFDMGGTSTDVGLCPGMLSRTTEATIGEIPIRVPVIDIHTVGAGGGSIAQRDPGGSLRVGPGSAGADPGPICYDRGGIALTVTDANLFLGRLSPDHFLGGEQVLPVAPVEEAMAAFASTLNLTPLEAAEGILRVVNATMERAIRVISLERGYDPRDFTLVCFGGAGAMHAADLAEGLNIPRVLVPQAAGILSALGMLMADFVRDYSKTLLLPCATLDPGDLHRGFGELEARAAIDYEAEGLPRDQLEMERSLDMRYMGQGYELAVPMGEDFESAFHDRHHQRYGYADARRATEVVNIRLRAVSRTATPPLPASAVGSEDASGAVLSMQRMVFGGEAMDAALMDRSALKSGNAFAGPALVVEYSTTTVVPPNWRCVVDGAGNLILEVAVPAPVTSTPAHSGTST